MSPPARGLARLLVLLAAAVILFLLFPAAFRFVEGAALSVMRLWWVLLLLALAAWLIWGVGRKPK